MTKLSKSEFLKKMAELGSHLPDCKPEPFITLNRHQALQLGLLWCSCGHRPNNHFGHDDEPCAHCDCKKYNEVKRLPKEK